MVLLQNFGSRVCGRLSGVYEHLGFTHVLSIAVLGLYSLVGGYIFMACERTSWENEKLRKLTIEYEKQRPRIEEIINTNITAWYLKLFLNDRRFGYRPDVLESHIRRATWWSLKELGLFSKDAPTLQDLDEESPWTLQGSIFFGGTLYTTIGYGNYAPYSTIGRTFTMFYALFGIPLVITILNDWGKLMFRLIRFAYSWLVSVFDRLGRFLRDTSRSGWKCALKQRRMSTAWRHLQEEEPDVPFLGAILILVLWICGSAGIILLLEPNGPDEDKWTYFQAVYFVFISLTTIGLGDEIPNRETALWSIPIIFIGLSVISMCINIIQSKLENLFQSLLGMIDSEYKNMQMGEGEMAGEVGGMGVMNLNLKQNWKQRLLFKMMDDNRKKQLEARWDDKAKMKTRATQTGILYSDMGVQASIRESRDEGGSHDNEEPPPPSVTRSGGKKSYIYNVQE